MKMRYVMSIITAVCINAGFADSLYVSGNIQSGGGAMGSIPLAGVMVTALFGSTGMASATTDASGNYSIASKPFNGDKPDFSFYLFVKSTGCYVDTQFMVTISSFNDGVADRITENFNLRRSGSCGDSLIITGTVKDSTGTPIGGASVRIFKGSIFWLETTSGTLGDFSFKAINRDTLKTFRMTAGAPGYLTKIDTVSIVNVKDGIRDSAAIQFQLKRNPAVSIRSGMAPHQLTTFTPSLNLIQGKLVLNFKSFLTSAKIGIHDMRGRTVVRAMAVGTDRVVLDAEHLKKGTYVVQFDDDAGRSGSFKVVVR